MAVNDEQFMTTREAARLLGVAQPTVQEWVERGYLASWKTPGGHRRVTRVSVEAMLDQRRRAIRGESPDPPCLLIVEDDPDMVALYRQKLSSLPVRLEVAKNGFEGLILAGLQHPVVIITDLDMPGMDGFRMIQAMMAHEVVSQARILVVTALNLAEAAARLPTALPLFGKPPPFDQIRALVLETVKGRGVWHGIAMEQEP